MVPTSAVVMMAVNAFLGFVLPVGLAWYMCKSLHVRLSVILIGAATFVVFALVLESLVHMAVLNGPQGAVIRDNVWYFATYGGLMAGLFEETGRFLSMKYLLRRCPSNRFTALGYGVGHGGVERIIVFGVTRIGNLVMSMMINGGQTGRLLSTVPAEAQIQMQTVVQQLQDATAATYLLGLCERLSAIVIHLGLSLIVFSAVRKGGRWLWLFPAAIVLHALVDGAAVLLNHSVSTAVLELIVFLFALVVFCLGIVVSRNMEEYEVEGIGTLSEEK